MLRRSIACALPMPEGFCIFGGLLFDRLESAPEVGSLQADDPRNGADYDLVPMGKGQAPGTTTGLGVCGAVGSEAGWAVRAGRAGR